MKFLKGSKYVSEKDKKIILRAFFERLKLFFLNIFIYINLQF